jgi:glycoprotein endo-alpha-1,2-mannosidase
MKNPLLALAVFLLCTTAFSESPHPNTVIFYYGWFPGNWNKQNAATGLPQLFPNNQCGTITSTHSHTASIPNDIASTYFPALGAYSTSTSSVLKAHRRKITLAGIKAVALSYGRNGQPSLDLIHTIYQRLTNRSVIRIAFAIRNYKPNPDGIQRTSETVKEDILNLLAQTGGATGKQYRVRFNNYIGSTNFRPVFYVFAPNDPQGGCGPGGGDDNWGDWGCIFTAVSRGWQPEPFIVLGQNANTATNVKANGFDGGYDYSPAINHSAAFYAANADDAWNIDNNWMYSAGVAPGYNTNRSKNDSNCRSRNADEYSIELTNARAAGPHFIDVISFNEWNEGTQIEPAMTQRNAMSGIYVNNSQALCGNPSDCGYQYLGYQGTMDYPTGPNIYLNVTADFIGRTTLWNPRKPVEVLGN